MAMSQLRHTLDCEGPPAACPPTGRAAAHACYVQCLATHDILQEICRKEKLTCQSIGITAKLQSKYEVEYLCDQMVIEGLDYYFVKWKGWPKSTNTWEPRSNLKCPLMLKRFHDDLNMYISKIKGGCPFITKKNVRTIKPSVVEFLVKKAKQRIALTRWKEELNRKKKQSGKIYVENTVDLEGPPLDFHYINEYKASPGICLNAEVLCGCDCSDCLLDKCCPAAAGVVFAYNEHKRLIIEPGFPIFECNSCCKCGLDCPNRVIQKGPPYSLCIFRTSNGRGWGVKTLQKIQRHSFVMEYVGEVITSEEAERRGWQYDCKGMTYLFDLDYVSDEFTVDAGRYGNISHFLNHSCDPNLQVFNFFIENLDFRLPRIALFSIRTIRAGEELTFDYQMKGSGELSSDLIGISPARRRVRTSCKCGSVHCRGYLN
ncbi:histone-lysine N-methyltransferase SUV39H2 isoform X1 [Ambystoma mexicanum]|uniref:histone-lysine N-methyltransferase SUV39H2 isoform X1 n=1 Tax=Ambystoma mexicanum TaxID=8296 RepID=UPI0037E86A71